MHTAPFSQMRNTVQWSRTKTTPRLAKLSARHARCSKSIKVIFSPEGNSSGETEACAHGANPLSSILEPSSDLYIRRHTSKAAYKLQVVEGNCDAIAHVAESLEKSRDCVSFVRCSCCLPSSRSATTHLLNSQNRYQSTAWF